MKNMFWKDIVQRVRITCAGVMSIVALSSLSACAVTTSNIESSDVVGPTIKIGIAFDRPGLSLFQNGSVSGFNAQIAQAIAYDLGYSAAQIEWVEVTDQTQDQLFQSSDIDMVVGVSQYSQVSSKTHNVEFSGPYVSAPLGILVRSQNATKLRSIDDLANKNVCSVAGENSDKLTANDVSTLMSGANQVFIQQTYSECMSALATTTVDAVVGDSLVLEQLQRRASGQNFALNLSDNDELDISYGVAVPSGDVRLYAKIQTLLAKIVQDGRWNRFISNIKNSSAHAQIKNLKAPAIKQPPDEQ
ncbi:transporter substrate-binding domain-containing protein [Alloscardovia theropitheci]|uniref:Transporter substrate-binding domain-containing protein n=1 Tax=Alloscardovia theropitheci TaxID=2496842 RepID=A0A4R0QN32_9BIFI|nr:transporter substrate-binding domain-containing protein [Alloscardovia theropitheci]TCD53554.1 transporter substrate-binding domain-containing protein [Alloscardovia theropitheci]